MNKESTIRDVKYGSCQFLKSFFSSKVGESNALRWMFLKALEWPKLTDNDKQIYNEQ